MGLFRAILPHNSCRPTVSPTLRGPRVLAEAKKVAHEASLASPSSSKAQHHVDSIATPDLRLARPGPTCFKKIPE